jgi:hypothetical protein
MCFRRTAANLFAVYMLHHVTASASDEAREGITAYLDEMITRPGFCLAVERDRALQRAMRGVILRGESPST